MKEIALALIGQGPAILTALAVCANVYVSLRNGQKSDAVGVQATTAATAAAAADAKAADLATGQQVIHTLVNSNLTKVKEELAATKEELAALHALVAQQTGKPAAHE